MLLLSEDHDHSAAWLAARLRAGGRETVHLTSSWMAGASISHAIDALGSVTTCLRGEDRAIELHAAPSGLNRLVAPPAAKLVGGPDADYAESERWALWASVCHSLPPGFLGRGGVHGLAGPTWSPARWRARAQQAGLRTARAGPGPANVLVVRGRAVGPRHLRSLGESYGRLADDAGCDVLGIQVDDGGAVVCATTHPALDRFGEHGVALIDEALA